MTKELDKLHDHNERIKMIDEFFNNLTIEEFEKMAIDCGVEEIKPVSTFGNSNKIKTIESRM